MKYNVRNVMTMASLLIATLLIFSANASAATHKAGLSKKIHQRIERKVLEQTRTNNFSILKRAIFHGDLNKIKFLIEEQRFDINNTKDPKNNSSALMYACAEENLDIVAYLIKKGADVNLQNKYGKTALHWASHYGRYHTVKYLVEHGAIIDVFDKNDGETPFMEAAEEGKLEIVKYLLEHGADIDARGTHDGETALMEAAEAGHLGVVTYLVEQGADINVQDIKEGETALMEAAEAGHLDIVKYLVEHGADVNIHGNKKNITALKLAKQNKHTVIVKYLRSQGAR